MLTFEVPLVRVRMGGRVGFSESRQQPLPKRASPMARCLALGHRIVKAVECGEMRGYGEIAERMGVSQPRVSMLVALTFLSPRIQETILAGEDEMGFRTLLKLARFDVWNEQETLAKAEVGGERNWGKTSQMVSAALEFLSKSQPDASKNESNAGQTGDQRGGLG